MSTVCEENYYFLLYETYDSSVKPYRTTFVMLSVNRMSFTVEKREFEFCDEAYPSSYWNGTPSCFIMNGYLYMSPGSYAVAGYYKFDLLTLTFIKRIDVIDENGVRHDAREAFVTRYGAFSRDYMIRSDDKIISSRMLGKDFDADILANADEAHYVGLYFSGSTVYFKICTPPLLFTVNNLNTPVVKTADKTMKITYILKEDLGSEPAS